MLNKGEFETSMYQTTIAKFSYAVFVQVITLIFLFGIRVIVQLGVESPSLTANVMNCLGLFTMFFLMSYSFLLVIQMTLNVFTLGQSNHFTNIIEAIKNRENK
jgi:predicted transporter